MLTRSFFGATMDLIDRINQLKQMLRETPQDWPEDRDQVPDWVCWRDELANLTGHEMYRARYRTARAFVSGFQAVASRAERTPEDNWKDLIEWFADGQRPTVLECADRWEISMSAASRKIQGWEAKGLIRSAKVGRTKRIVWVRTPLKLVG